jgi:minor extracellular serine protease Vpr
MEYIIRYSGTLPQLSLPVERLNERYAILTCEPDEADRVRFLPEIEYLEQAERLFASHWLRASAASAATHPSNMWLDGRGVAIGVIDSGIDADHPAFLSRNGSSRVLSVWDLTREGMPPEGFYKGCFCQGEEILLSQDATGHGTAVAGIAAGAEGIAPESSLMVVKLGGQSTRTTDLMRGVQHLIDRSRQLQMPCVLNLSYGSNLGSHKGQSLFETYLEDAAQSWKTVIVCAGGNEGAGAHHYRNRLTSGQSIAIDFAVAPFLPFLYLDIWGSPVDELVWELTAPNGRTTGSVPLYEKDWKMQLAGAAVEIHSKGPTCYTSDREVLFSITGNRFIPDGIWTLRCSGGQITEGDIDVWLPTTEEVGEQTAFLQPSPELTATIPSTAGRVIAVGGYRAETGTLSSFSGRGDSSRHIWPIPSLTAPAEGVRSARAGGGYDIYTGTSMASPFVAGAAALLMEWGIVQGNDPFLYGQRVRAFLQKYANRRNGVSYPNPLWGYGELNIEQTLRGLEEGGV